MNFYLAPMEGITTFIYRNTYKKYYGNMDKYFTPFVANQKLKNRELREVLPENNKDMPVVPQILANKSDTFLKIANQLSDMGYNEVNLNLGCPSGTVVAKKRGAGFLSDLEGLERFLDEIYDKCPLPISIKTRIGVDSPEEWDSILKIYSRFQVKELIVHARTLKQLYKGSPNHDAWGMALDRLSCPMCYNGDIIDLDSYEFLLSKYPDTSSIMLGRGAIANPNLANELLCDPTPYASKSQHNSNSDVPKPHNLPPHKSNSPSSSSNVFNKSTDPKAKFHAFHNELLDSYIEYMPGDQPVLYKMKDLWTFWNLHLQLDAKLLKKIRKTQSVSDYKSITEEYLFFLP